VRPRSLRDASELRTQRCGSLDLETTDVCEFDLQPIAVTLTRGIDSPFEKFTEVDHLEVRSHGSSPGKRRSPSDGYYALIHLPDDKKPRYILKP
jgi:hypothetical protein